MMLYVTDDMLFWVAKQISALRPPPLLRQSDGEHHVHIRRPYLYFMILSVLFLIVTHLCSPKRAQRASLKHIPKYHASKWRWWFGAEDLLKESYEKFPGRPYQIDGPDGIQVALPAKYIGEAKMMPDTTLDSEIATNEKLQTKYTGFPIANEKRDKLISLLRTKISPSIVADLVPRLKSELEHLASTEFPRCENWTSVKWQAFGLRTIARLSGSVFVGSAVSRREDWTQTTIDFAMHVFIAGAKLSMVPSWARPLAQYFVGELGKIQGAIGIASEALSPLLAEKARTGTEEDEYVNLHEDSETFLDSLIEALDDSEKWDPKVQAELQLMLAAASIHTTGHVLCECMYELAILPNLQEELRWEVMDVACSNLKLGPRGWADGLQKMDSFMREVQRVHGNMAAFFRKVMKPTTFADGTYLPTGTSIFTPQAAVSLEDQYYPDAQTFDPLRFYKLRNTDGNRRQFTAPSDSNMHFGIGRHTCPGRYLASVEVKVVLAHFLLNYEIRLKPGTQRPKPFALAMTKSPRQDVELEFRRRI